MRCRWKCFSRVSSFDMNEISVHQLATWDMNHDKFDDAREIRQKFFSLLPTRSRSIGTQAKLAAATAKRSLCQEMCTCITSRLLAVLLLLPLRFVINFARNWTKLNETKKTSKIDCRIDEIKAKIKSRFSFRKKEKSKVKKVYKFFACSCFKGFRQKEL